MVKTLRIDHPIKVDDKPIYARIRRILKGVYRAEFWYGDEKLAEGTVRASNFLNLIKVVRSQLDNFLKEIIERR